MRTTYRANRVTELAVLALLIVPNRLTPAVIVVDDTCSLADAITAANTDSATGGCPAGSGADELQLTGDVTLTEELPSVASEISVGPRRLGLHNETGGHL